MSRTLIGFLAVQTLLGGVVGLAFLTVLWTFSPQDLVAMAARGGDLAALAAAALAGLGQFAMGFAATALELCGRPDKADGGGLGRFARKIGGKDHACKVESTAKGGRSRTFRQAR